MSHLSATFARVQGQARGLSYFSTPSCFPTSVNAAIARSICSVVCAADTCMRMRACALRHHRVAEPDHVDAALQQFVAIFVATAASPSITGRIGVGPGLIVNPAASSPAAQLRRVRLQLRPQVARAVRPVPAPSSRPRPAPAAREFENRYGRDRFRSQSTISALAAVNPPLAPPSVLPSVPVMTSMRSSTPSSSAAAAAGRAEVPGRVAVVDARPRPRTRPPGRRCPAASRGRRPC